MYLLEDFNVGIKDNVLQLVCLIFNVKIIRNLHNPALELCPSCLLLLELRSYSSVLSIVQS